MKSLLNILAVSALFTTAGMAANLLTNGSFESGSFVENANGGVDMQPGSTIITGWTVVNGETAWLTNGAFGLTPEDGTYFLDLTGYSDQLPRGGVSQTVNLGAGNYALTFYLGENQSIGLYAGPVSVLASAGNQSNVVFSSTVPAGSTGNIWQGETLDFSVSAAGNTSISIIGNTTAGGQYIGLDNVNLAAISTVTQPPPPTATPEPATALPVLLSAASGLMWRLRRRAA